AKKLLTRHGQASLRDILAAEKDLDTDSKLAWRSEVVADLERATKAAIATETLDREALVALIQFVEPFEDKPLFASVAGWIGARGYTALYKDKEQKKAAHRLLEKLDARSLPAELATQIAAGISAAIVVQIPDVASGKRFDLARILPDLIDIEKLRSIPSEAVIDKIVQLAGDKGSAFFEKDGEATMRCEVLAVLVAAGMMPPAEKQLKPSRRTAETKEKRLEVARMRAHLAENLAKENEKVPLVRLVAALGMFLVAIELDKLQSNGQSTADPSSECEKLCVAASEMFEKARGELESPYAIAFASYERAWLLLRGALRGPNIKPGLQGMHHPEHLAGVIAQIDSTKLYARPWALQEFRVEVEHRHLVRVTEEIYRKTRPHKLLEGKANPNAKLAVDNLPEAKAAFGRVMATSEVWRTGLGPVFIEADALHKRSGGDGPPLDAREARRHIELSNLYILQSEDAYAEITKLRSDSRRRLAYIAKIAGDEETTTATASDGEKELLEAARANPQKVTFRQDRVELLILLGRRDEARALNDEVLRDRTLGELDGNDRARAEEWREILK
ncbi:MAG: hypothetical protein ACAI25_13820, partial [Planctomycetota bacterium]